MIPELNPNDIGRQLGADGVNSVVAKVEQYCGFEEQRITLQITPASSDSGRSCHCCPKNTAKSRIT